MNAIAVKEYDTLRISCEYQDDMGHPLSLEMINIEARMTSTNNHYSQPLNVEMSNRAKGMFVLASENNHIMPTLYKVDVMFLEVASGNRITSDTFNVSVLESVTIPDGVTI